MGRTFQQAFHKIWMINKHIKSAQLSENNLKPQ